MTKLLAVYGTLKRGFHNNYLLQTSKLLGKIYTKPHYTMYKLGSFPTVTKGGDTSIECEIYEVTNPKVLQDIYELEQYTGIIDDPRNWYNVTEIKTEFGLAEMFFFTQKPSQAASVWTGIWV